MIPNKIFLQQNKTFWAYVRSISQTVGYTDGRGLKKKSQRVSQIKVPSITEMATALDSISLDGSALLQPSRPTTLARHLHAYFEYRAQALNEYVRPRLMNVEQAAHLFENLKQHLSPTISTPMNKQKGDKKAPAYFTGIVNMLIESAVYPHEFDHDPHLLATVTNDGAPLRTFSRRVDGAFPSTVNPIAIWEIKEYYYTTTFGSRVADGVYETLLDGMEVEELRRSEGIDVLHYLMVDGYFTWWDCGRSYLCRLVDMLHMGYISEVLFGAEVVDRIPPIVRGWTEKMSQRTSR